MNEERQEKTSKMIIKQQDIVNTVQPRTANLLACRQWWKVCFLHGSQEKYYRQIYGRAAAQRLALAQQNKEQSLVSSRTTIIYPTKQSHPVVLHEGSPKIIELRKLHRKSSINKEPIIPHSRVTVLDDPFLFGIENDGCESDSGIDANPKSKNAQFPSRNLKPILKTRFPSKPRGTSASSTEGSPLNAARSRNGIVNTSEIFFQSTTSDQSLQNLRETKVKIKNKQCRTDYTVG